MAPPERQDEGQGRKPANLRCRNPDLSDRPWRGWPLFTNQAAIEFGWKFSIRNASIWSQGFLRVGYRIGYRKRGCKLGAQRAPSRPRHRHRCALAFAWAYVGLGREGRHEQRRWLGAWPLPGSGSANPEHALRVSRWPPNSRPQRLGSARFVLGDGSRLG